MFSSGQNKKHLASSFISKITTIINLKILGKSNLSRKIDDRDKLAHKNQTVLIDCVYF
jgi:hypothetical protein